VRPHPVYHGKLASAVTATYQHAGVPAPRPWSGEPRPSRVGGGSLTGRHRKEDEDGSPPEVPNEGPPGGLTWRKLNDFVIRLSLPVIFKIIDWWLYQR
jgi:hypothetical protein